MGNVTILSFMKKVPFQSTEVTLREYDYKSDPEKLVVYLFDKMDSEEGIKALKQGDEWLQDPNRVRKRLVAEIEGELYATTTVEQGMNHHTQHRFRLYAVVTAPQYQGTGLSQILFEYVKEWIKIHGGTLILVETWETNLRARRFYEKMGFNQYAILPNGLKKRTGDGYTNEIMYILEIQTH